MAYDGGGRAAQSRYSDEELLKFVGEERKRSIGFGEGESGELEADREKALNYAKGVMKDVPAAENRSAVIDTSVADAIETVLPDVMEVFVGGDDIATFIPMGEQDEAAAQEESDYVRHVIMEENPGFLILYTACKDAMLTKTGVFHWWAEDEDKEETKAETSPEQAQLLQAVAGEMGQDLETEEREDGTVALISRQKRMKVCVRAYPSEDFTVSPDTVNLPDTPYCAVRERPRVQDLIARGIGADKARSLPTFATHSDTVEQARDQAGESEQTAEDSHGDLRTVEIRCHYIRLGDESGKLSIWRVVTDAQETKLLESEEVDHIPFSAITPYIVPHRFYGQSVADKLIEVQKIKTTLLRMLLDSGYFALNQRMVVNENAASDFTISDLLANQPGHPIRVKGENAVTPVTAGGLGFDVFSAMEFMSTVAEQRSGIVRNAQGLNPDTLHDTAKGAMALITAAQKRVRLIARIFAETGVKDLFLGVHRMLRTSYTDEHAPAQAKLRNQWKTIQPNSWAEREGVAIHVGVGSAGKEHDLMVATQRLQMQGQLAQMPGAMGTLLDKENLHQGFMAWERAAGTRSPDVYWTNPTSEEAKAAEAQQAQQPNPEMAKAQAQLQLKQQEGQANLQLQAAQAQQKAQLDAAQGARDHELAMARLAAETQLARERAQAELDLKRDTAAQELAMKREVLMAELEMKRNASIYSAQLAAMTGGQPAAPGVTVSDVQPGGDPG